MNRPQRKGPDYLARLGAAKHRVFADRLTPKAVDALTVLATLCAMDADIRSRPPLNDRLHLAAMLARVGIAVEDDTATPAEETALREAVTILTEGL